MKKNTNKVLIILWFTLFVLACLLLLFNMTINLSSTNWYVYLIDFGLIALAFLPIGIISIRFKQKGKKLIFGFILEAFFALTVFVSIAESTIDSAGTVKQVNNLLDFFTGKKKTDKAPESFTIELIDIKDEYKINDIIKYNVNSKGEVSNPALACEIKNNLVKVDIINKTIECLKNGEEELTFYSIINKKITYKLTLTINSKVITNIKFNETKKDIFLDINEKYQLNNPIITPSDAEVIDYTYSTTDSKVAIVDENGLIEAVGYGNTVIKCQSGEAVDSIYVCVGANTKLDVNEEMISIYPEYDNYVTLYVYMDNVSSFDWECISYSYDSKYKLSFIEGILNSNENLFTFGVYHKNTSLTEKQEIELEIIYTYKGGTKISDKLIVEMLPYGDIRINNIDLEKTSLNINQDIYYDNNNKLITKYVSANIEYSNIAKLNKTNFKYESESLDVANSVYDMLIIDLSNSDLELENHIVKLYPSKNIDEFIEFKINLNKIYMTKDLDKLDFELNKLYSKDENKKNEIYFKYFNKSLFTDVAFNNEYYNNSGLLVELSEESKKYANIIVDELGIIKELKLLKFYSNNIAMECELTFYVSSVCDPEVKKEYVINVKSQYDDLLVSIDKKSYSDNFEVNLYEGESFSLSYKYIMNLEYKGKFQTSFKPSTNQIEFSTDNKNAIAWKSNTITAVKKGVAVLTAKLSSTSYKDDCEVKITINIAGPDDSISTITTKKEIVKYNENCAPNLEKGYCSVGTIIKIYVDNTDDYIFKSSDETIVKIENGMLTALKSGSVNIITQYKKDLSISTNYKLKVYDVVLPFEVAQGKFSKLTKTDGKFSVNARVGQQYKINLSIPDSTTSTYFTYTTKNKNIELSDTGSVAVNKAGKYTITIQNGENDSPYKEKVTLIINATSTGFSSQFVYFIRKLAGHFTLFMFIAIFGLITLKITFEFKKKIRNLIIILAVFMSYGFLIASSTELIQAVTPGRTCYIGDVWLNMNGFVTGVIIVLAINVIILIFKKIKHKRS